MKKCYHYLFCLKCFLLMFLALNLSKAFELKCPSSKQWLLRASSRCLIADGYICLFDENRNTFGEICINRTYVDPAGYKFVIAGNLDRRKCASSSYQPFTFSTKGTSTCIFEKTYCSEEGQIIFNNGSSNSDRKCRCDYTRGYDFITKPKHSCYCVPSMEDCSCCQKHCTPGFILSPDYQCINLTSWDSQFTCELILPYHPKDTNFPSHDNNLDKSVAASRMNVRIVLSIAVGVTIIFTLIIVQITLFCLPRIESFKDAKKNVLRENVELKSLLAGKVISQNIRDLQQHAKKKWKKQFNRFVETRASKAIFERLKQEQCFIISGPFGCGKSSLAFHTALKLEETLGFDFMIISNPDDFLRYASEDKKQIFLIDDAFGKYYVSTYDTIWWIRQDESINHLLKRNINLRLLMTSRLSIYRSVKRQQMKVRFCLLNLISKEVALTFEERQMIGRCYLQDDMIDNLSEDVVSTYSFFPMLCGIFNIYSKENIVDYFTNPVQYIKTEIENFLETPDLFCLALAVLIVFDNDVKKNIFNDDNPTYDRLFMCISKEIGYTRYKSKTKLYSSFTALTDSYVSDQESSFACLHVNLFNALAFCIGPKIIHSILLYGTTAFIIDKMQLKTSCSHYPKFTIIIPNSLHASYLKRMLLDMKTASYNIFIGSQHLSAEFRQSYIAYMKKHLKKEDLRKGIDKTTVLHLVSAEGYTDYVEYFLDLDKQMVKELDKFEQTALHKTCMKGHLRVASLLLDKGIYIDQSDKDSKTALDIACDCGLIDMVDLLLSRHATIRQKTSDFSSPLHVACSKSNFKIAELLLKKNADVNQRDYNGYSPLHLACQKGSIEIATMLITHRAIIDMEDLKGETSLHTACRNGHCKIAELLLVNRANANKRNLVRNTPILIACEKKHMEIIKLLLEYKADVNCKNKALLTPLHVAYRNNSTDIVLLLIKHGALVNEPDTNFQTPLFIACSKGYHIVKGKIIENGASITTGNQNDETPLHVDDNERNEETVKVLLNAGANVNQGDTYEITPIQLACKAQREEIVKLLINAGADVNKNDQNGITPLDMARKGGQNEILSLLLNAKVNVNKSDKHSTPPLHMACTEGSEATVKTLLNAGAHVNEVDKDGMTPLHAACKGGQEEIVTMLINAGVNVNKGDTNGVTPLHMSCIEGNEAIVKVFLNSIANVNVKDKDGMTPLNIACKHGHNDIATLLLKAGANGNRADKKEITTLHMSNKGEREVTTNVFPM
ncbi:serine/threonine-protein phosphatase 6 regulatory ankyrin repeat subunit C-like [Mytilus californianus]|uniref:serine/threonine-protein phosphatase 6 regulatory ankyrin repeat subunit C-like n=1 Tax=Mytilus californianus TaxID=6549 RepID=UPI0022463486|nr:serine/threonine-protein phosphatase 6 regulatory ankyrin repeat subunit C-like [Mytilus californianus]